jgi:hypothetical protein
MINITFKEAMQIAHEYGIKEEIEGGDHVTLILYNENQIIIKSEYDEGYSQDTPGHIESPTCSIVGSLADEIAYKREQEKIRLIKEQKEEEQREIEKHKEYVRKALENPEFFSINMGDMPAAYATHIAEIIFQSGRKYKYSIVNREDIFDIEAK